MSKADFWLVVGIWYFVLVAVLFAGVNRFGLDYMSRTLAEPTVANALFLTLFLLPVPFIVRRNRA